MASLSSLALSNNHLSPLFLAGQGVAALAGISTYNVVHLAEECAYTFRSVPYTGKRCVVETSPLWVVLWVGMPSGDGGGL